MSVSTVSGSLSLRRVGDGGRDIISRSSGSGLDKMSSLSASSKPVAVSSSATISPNSINSNKDDNPPSSENVVAVSSQGSAVTPTPSSGTPPVVSAETPAPTSSSSSSTMRIYGKIVLTLENVLIPNEKLSLTPSVQDGMDPQTEWEFRVVGCELISSAGILLKLPQTAMATGQVLFHRFYYCKSFLRQEMEYTAMACIYLASKIEEAPRRIRDVINVFDHLQQLRNGKTVEPMILDQVYIHIKSEVTLAERRVLKELGFCVHVKHPHKLIVVYMQQLGYDRDSNFVQMSWNYMSDALRSNVFVRYKPEAIACACIYLSARKLKINLPSNPSWYIVFDVEEYQITDICESILELYERPRTDYDQFVKNMKGMRKAFKESKEKAKGTPRVGDKITEGATDIANPTSRPSSPNPGSGGSAVSSVTQSKDVIEIKEKRRNDESDHSGLKSSGNSPASKKARRSPSPIVLNDSPQRHKKKKRRRSRSDSSSPSLSRGGSRSGKKHNRRDRSRSRSPYSPKRQHHKKSKAHHRDRFRSRSRSYSPNNRDDRYDRGYDKQYYKKSSKTSKHPRDRDEDSMSSNKSRGRDKDRR